MTVRAGAVGRRRAFQGYTLEGEERQPPPPEPEQNISLSGVWVGNLPVPQGKWVGS